jgi:anti-sigma B factor antagonist
MKQDFNAEGEKMWVTLVGSMYVEEAAVLRKNLIGYIDEGIKNFLIDMERVDYIDSSGLGVLVGIKKRALEKGGGIAIRGLNGTVKEIFELTRLTKVFEMV